MLVQETEEGNYTAIGKSINGERADNSGITVYRYAAKLVTDPPIYRNKATGLMYSLPGSQ